MRWLCVVLLLFLAVTDQKLASGQQNYGKVCHIKNQIGYCQLLTQCRSVYAELVYSRKRPDFICGYYGYVPIVCCPHATVGGNNGIQQPIIPSPAPVKTMRRAEQKCHEYAKSVHVDKLIGGNKASIREFPHMAAIGFVKNNTVSWDCGGSLISEHWVLTAAHCTFDKYWGYAEYVRVGDLNLEREDDDAKPQTRKVVERVRHPNYKKPALYNDIALLKMDKPVEFNAYIRPACLSLDPNIRPNEQVIASGWGVTDWFENKGSPELLKVTLPIVAYDTCKGYYENEGSNLPNGISSETQFCAGETGKDTCQGDSGGPLMVYSKSTGYMYDIIGITSFGKPCGFGTPGIYTKVYYYLDWIEQTVWLQI